MKYLAGLSTGNVIRRATSLTVSPAEDALFPRANLYDGLPSKRYKVGSTTTPVFLTTDQNLVVNPGFESSPLVNWTSGDTGTGVSSDTGVTVHSGAHALKVNGGAAGVAQRSQSYIVRSGERLFVSAWMRGPGGTARLRIFDFATSKYLTSGGTWTSAATDLLTSANAVYEQKTFAFQVESFDVHQSPTTTLALILYTTSNGDAFFDDVALFPTINFCGIFGHNIQPGFGGGGTTITFASSDDGFVSTSTIEATMTPYQPSFYATITPANHQYWAFTVNGPNIIGLAAAPIWIGEMVFGYVETALTSPEYPFTTSRVDPQLRSDGGEYAFLQRNSESPGVMLPTLSARNEAAYLEQVQNIWKMSRGDTIVVVPVDGERRVMLGRLPDRIQDERAFLNLWRMGLQLDPLPFPSIVT